MLDKFLAFVNSKNLFEKEDKVLLAVSGGIDSMVMARLFKESGFRFGVAHCNFQLRAEASDEDEAFVKMSAKNMSVDFYSKNFQTNKYAKENAVSTQIAARELRYNWFFELIDIHEYNYIATAHHLNDSLETVLYNLTKGTGINGLTGIDYKSDKIIRPMMFATREEVEKYAAEKNITWSEDESNATDSYNRNHIRHNVVEKLKDINPSLEHTFENTLERLMSVSNILKSKLEEFKTKNVKVKKSDIYINKRAALLAELAILDELLKPYGFNFVQVKSIKDSLTSNGQLFYADNYVLNIDREFVIISKRLEADDAASILVTRDESEINLGSIHLDFQHKSIASVSINKDNTTAQVDNDLLNYPLKVRKWREGDSFQPLGMKGKKKLSDFMIDSKIPLNLKERVMVLESDGEIVWVVGHRLDDRFKITSETKNCLEIRLVQND